MKHQAAYSLLTLAGKKPSQADVEKFMKEAGVTVDKDALTAFFKCMEGKEAHTAIQAGAKKTISMPAAGARPAAGGAAAGGKAAAAAPAKEEKKEEVEEVDMGGLFGGDDEY